MLRLLVTAVLISGACSAVHAQTIYAGMLRADVRQGVVTNLVSRDGTVYASGAEPRGLGCLRVAGKDLAPRPAGETTGSLDLPGDIQYRDLEGGEGALDLRVGHDDEAGEMTLKASGRSRPGLQAAQWGIAGIPLDFEVLVPGNSGLRLDRKAPMDYMEFQYPINWEAQLVVFQQGDRGFYVWAEDAQGRYKKLRLWRKRDGVDVAFESQPNAPFDDKSQVDGVTWRIGGYQGDWRVPARRYRDWAEANLHPTRLADQQPGWVKDMRLMVLCGMELPLLEQMAARLDPEQTILYVANWRRDGYDRNYPDYTALPELRPFIEKAHTLGFRVMLHVNYFGCDPKNELYAQFKPYQTRDPNSKDLLWWEWPPPHKQKPDTDLIKFAYINPAHKPWRDLFVSRMKELCEEYPVDALHLDQTLCIWNDSNGLMDGMTMIEGSLAEHRELRAALPGVALSGEGLNEVTCRYEAFAQRHVWGMDHSEGTWNRALLACAHPISSYLLRPFTIINGYLGMSSPGNEQNYAAWMQAYSNWGVIPTFAWMNPDQLKNPGGFARQLLDEIAFYQEGRVDPDMDGEWAEDTLFPYKAASGERARYVRDRGFALVREDGREVSRTVTGVDAYPGPGSIPDWLCYDETRIFGLKPTAWYPLFPEPRDLAAFHVSKPPEGLTVTRALLAKGLATISVADPGRTVGRVEDLLAEARSGYTVFDGQGEETDGPLHDSPGGAQVAASGQGVISFHPPWKAQRVNPQTKVLEAGGTGTVYTVVRMKLPAQGKIEFLSEVFMAEGSTGEGKTDGVTYSVLATDGETPLSAQVHNALTTPVPLALDLSPLAGKEISLRLEVDPGPQRLATFDWARWRDARVEVDRQTTGTLEVVSPDGWATAIASAGLVDFRPADGNRWTITTGFPGTVFLLRSAPTPVTLPCDLAKLPFLPSFCTHDGATLRSPQYAAAGVGSSTVGGVERSGFSTHPPNQGQTRQDFALVLCPETKSFRCQVGLRDGSQSNGCLFSVEVNGQEVARKLMMPGGWQELSADLSAWAGEPVVLTLVTDSDTDFSFDWAAWAAPFLD